jgi:hypothetical protein
VRIVAVVATSPSFAISEGWTVSGPRSIHREAPYSAVPDAGRAAIAISTAATPRSGRPITRHRLGSIRASTTATAIPTSA